VDYQQSVDSLKRGRPTVAFRPVPDLGPLFRRDLCMPSSRVALPPDRRSRRPRRRICPVWQARVGRPEANHWLQMIVPPRPAATVRPPPRPGRILHGSPVTRSLPRPAPTPPPVVLAPCPAGRRRLIPSPGVGGPPGAGGGGRPKAPWTRCGAPTVVNPIVSRPGHHPRRMALVWFRGGGAGTGPFRNPASPLPDLWTRQEAVDGAGPLLPRRPGAPQYPPPSCPTWAGDRGRGTTDGQSSSSSVELVRPGPNPHLVTSPRRMKLLRRAATTATTAGADWQVPLVTRRLGPAGPLRPGPPWLRARRGVPKPRHPPPPPWPGCSRRPGT